MIGHTRVSISKYGHATIRTDGSDPERYDPHNPAELHFPDYLVLRARNKAKECCKTRIVYYPIGTHYCPCLACCIDVATQKWLKTYWGKKYGEFLKAESQND